MLTVLAALVGSPDDQFEQDPTVTGLPASPPASPQGKPQTGLSGLSNERMNTASTAATEEVLLEQIPFLVEVLPKEDGTPLGITVSLDDDPSYLSIDDVRSPGLIAEWNESHSEDLMVCTGHVIISVNGTLSSAQDMLDSISSLKKGVPLQLLVQPPVLAGGSMSSERERQIISIDEGTIPDKPQQRDTLLVELKPREGIPLGLKVSIDDDPGFVSIDGISDPGLITEWNSSRSEEFRVRTGDAITSVNRCSGNGRKLLDMLTSIQNVNRGAVMQLRIEPGHIMRHRKHNVRKAK